MCLRLTFHREEIFGMEKTARHDAAVLKAELFESKGRPEPEEGFQEWIKTTLEAFISASLVFGSWVDKHQIRTFKVYYGLESGAPIEYERLAEGFECPEPSSEWYVIHYRRDVEKVLGVLHNCAEQTFDGFLEMVVLGMSVDQLELSVRSWNTIHRAGIKTVGELIKCPASRLREGGNFGVKSLKEINNLLEDMKLPCIQ